MANEWTPIELRGPNRDGEIRQATIADGTAVSQGTVMTWTDDRTVIVAVAPTISILAYAGVTSEEKNADDGAITISMWSDGDFTATCSGAIPQAGQLVVGGEQNYIMNSAAISVATSGGILAQILQVGANNERVNVRIKL